MLRITVNCSLPQYSDHHEPGKKVDKTGGPVLRQGANINQLQNYVRVQTIRDNEGPRIVLEDTLDEWLIVDSQSNATEDQT